MLNDFNHFCLFLVSLNILLFYYLSCKYVKHFFYDLDKDRFVNELIFEFTYFEYHNIIFSNNKPGVLNGASAGESPSASGRPCESCYSMYKTLFHTHI